MVGGLSSNPIWSRVHEDGTERTLKEYLLKIVTDLIDTIETLEKSVLELMNNKNKINK